LLSLFILGCKYGVCQLFNLAYVGNTHLFSISLVATSYSVCNIFGRGSSILSPLVAEVKPESISKWTFIFIMLICLAGTSIIRDPKKKKKEEEQKQKYEQPPTTNN